MKTPRELLFARHQAALPKLDAIRGKVVRELKNQETKEQSLPPFLVASLLGCSNKLWRELVWPCRPVWTGMAAVWVLLAIINLSQRDGSRSNYANSAPAVPMMMSLQAQQRWVNELLADRSPPPEVVRPRIYSPKPRTERSEVATV